MTKLATTHTNPDVQVEAIRALAETGILTAPITTTLTNLATTDQLMQTRSKAVRALRYATATKKLQGSLIPLLTDRNDDVRREASATLIEFSRRHPQLAPDLLPELARACSSAARGRVFTWDEAYETSRAYTEVASPSFRKNDQLE